MQVGRLAGRPLEQMYYDEAAAAGAGAKADPPKDDVEYYKAEAQKAFKARDELKSKLREFEGRVLSDEDRALFDKLKVEQDKAEENRKKKAGEWEALRQQQAETHAKAQKELQDKYDRKDRQFRSSVIEASFTSAADYFNGSENSKTIWDFWTAQRTLGEYIQVEDVEDDPDGLGFRVIVKHPKGHTILGADGNPAPFADAIGELIAALPNKDRILRGSGKTGSGSSGGTHNKTGGPIDTRNLRPGDFLDPKVRDQVRREHDSAGGLQVGRAFDAIERAARGR